MERQPSLDRWLPSLTVGLLQSGSRATGVQILCSSPTVREGSHPCNLDGATTG